LRTIRFSSAVTLLLSLDSENCFLIDEDEIREEQGRHNFGF